ncbi:MAG: MarR family EPS-associated transcriptional regulator [Deltaproteobacteria bacterium]|nr:MarR family EPS-associated transcriptional regulator [Deltaproteobacteria bacterium]
MAQTKLDDSLTYELFKNLEADPHLSQRALSRILGISLGKVNYCLKALINKGWVKAKNFEQSPNKAGYAYILTPTGLETKARVTARFLRAKIAEYEKLQKEIEDLRREVEEQCLF